MRESLKVQRRITLMFPHRLLILVNFNRNLSQFRHIPRICSFFHRQLPCSSFFIVIDSLKSFFYNNTRCPASLYMRANTRDTQRAPLVEQKNNGWSELSRFQNGGGRSLISWVKRLPNQQKVPKKPI